MRTSITPYIMNFLEPVVQANKRGFSVQREHQESSLATRERKKKTPVTNEQADNHVLFIAPLCKPNMFWNLLYLKVLVFLPQWFWLLTKCKLEGKIW